MSNCGGLSPGQRGVCECASVFFFCGEMNPSAGVKWAKRKRERIKINNTAG